MKSSDIYLNSELGQLYDAQSILVGLQSLAWDDQDQDRQNLYRMASVAHEIIDKVTERLCALQEKQVLEEKGENHG